MDLSMNITKRKFHLRNSHPRLVHDITNIMEIISINLFELRGGGGHIHANAFAQAYPKVNHGTYKNSARTSQETHYVSATKPNRLMLFRETVAVYCENHTEHTDTRNAEPLVRIYTTAL
jgi:hypothetical protein